MLVQVIKIQGIQKVHDWKIIGETKFQYKEYSVILNILKIQKLDLNAAQN